MRGVAAGAWLMVAACSFNPGGSDAAIVTGGGGDGSGSATGPTCFAGSSAFAFCIATPTTELELPASFVDTGTQGSHDGCAIGVYAMVGSAEACVVAGTKVTLAAGATFTAVHDYPLVIASTGDIVIDGQVDVSTRGAGQRGAGTDPAVCDRGGLDGDDGDNGAAGGAGGTFGTVGGDGGDNGGGDGGGNAISRATPAAGLRGGCPGGAGGTGQPGTLAGAVADGGGAVLLAAKGTLKISGIVNASGECGHGGQTGGGGGAGASGGASGGMIVLAAAVFDVTGELVANGGGGGGGGGENNGDGGSGSIGSLPDPATPTVPAPGGAPIKDGGSGGAGAASSGSNVMAAVRGGDASQNGGGGGGGGGEGVIGFLGSDFVAPIGNVSPAAFPFPE